MDVTTLWWLSLAIFAVVTIVVAVLLGLIIAAAKDVDRRAAAIWLAGKQIAGNTVSIWMLEDVSTGARRIEERAGSITRSVESLRDALRAVASTRG